MRDQEKARALRVAALRLDACIAEVVAEAEALRKQGEGHRQFTERIRKLELDLDRLSCEPSAAAHLLELEFMRQGEGPSPPAEMIRTGAGEPSLLSLVSLLFCLGQTDSEPGEMEMTRAVPAFMFLVRNHPPTLERLRTLADEAKDDSGRLADAMLLRAESRTE